MIRIHETDPVLGALAKLPAPVQEGDARARALERTLRTLRTLRASRALATGETDGDRTGDGLEPAAGSFLGRWLRTERLVPALLGLAGTLYTGAALHQLTLVFGSDQPSALRTAQGQTQGRVTDDEQGDKPVPETLALADSHGFPSQRRLPR